MAKIRLIARYRGARATTNLAVRPVSCRDFSCSLLIAPYYLFYFIFLFGPLPIFPANGPDLHMVDWLDPDDWPMLYVGTLELATDSPCARARRSCFCTLGGGGERSPEYVNRFLSPAESIAPCSRSVQYSAVARIPYSSVLAYKHMPTLPFHPSSHRLPAPEAWLLTYRTLRAYLHTAHVSSTCKLELRSPRTNLYPVRRASVLRYTQEFLLSRRKNNKNLQLPS